MDVSVTGVVAMGSVLLALVVEIARAHARCATGSRYRISRRTGSVPLCKSASLRSYLP
jgi:hypothetical protein